MHVGLCQVDGKWPNLALMKLSAYHKQRGDMVEWYVPLLNQQYDVVYASKVFVGTPAHPNLPETAIVGGSGYDLSSELPEAVEAMCPDYERYPEFRAALGLTTRGCIRQCPFCVVPEKEGRLRIVADDIRAFWTGQPELRLLDNNLTAAPIEHFRRIFAQVAAATVALDVTQGFDLRLLTDEHAALLAGVRWHKQVRAAWDNPREEIAIRRGLETLLRYVPAHKVMVYVLIGYDTTEEEDLHRVEVLRGYRVDPFAMPYDGEDPHQRAFARWCNHKAIFEAVPWVGYSRRPRVADGSTSGQRDETT